MQDIELVEKDNSNLLNKKHLLLCKCEQPSYEYIYLKEKTWAAWRIKDTS